MQAYLKRLLSFVIWVLLPIFLLYLLHLESPAQTFLVALALDIGNIQFSLFELLRVGLYSILVFWLGRESNQASQSFIKGQKRLTHRSKAVLSKLAGVLIFSVVGVLMLNIMGINLTALAVFGGAVGVGLGLGLQTIASNFISGVIILLDKSMNVGDFIEMDDGTKGRVREFTLRYTILETYDNKDIVVPNEKFIANTFVNWSHKDAKQRYRVDFSVAYKTDIHALVDSIKAAVSAHPQVLSGEQYPIEERPDCEIDSFGDNGINMFVEFWMDGIDDGVNRVGGDLMLIILDTLRANDIEIPFPQRDIYIKEQPPK